MELKDFIREVMDQIHEGTKGGGDGRCSNIPTGPNVIGFEGAFASKKLIRVPVFTANFEVLIHAYEKESKDSNSSGNIKLDVASGKLLDWTGVGQVKGEVDADGKSP